MVLAYRHPFTFTHRFMVKLSDIQNEYDTLGFILKEEPLMRHCFISGIQTRSTAAQYPRWHSQLIGAFIWAVDDTIVFSKDDMEAALCRCLVDSAQSSSPVTANITFAHDCSLIRSQIDPDASVPSLIRLDQIHHIAHIFETGEEIKYQPRVDAEWFHSFDDLVQKLSIDVDEYIKKTSTSQFTRKQLMKRDDFKQSIEAKYKQLDTHKSDGMFGKPYPRPPKSVVLRSIWMYLLKWDGTRKAWNCGDGRPLQNELYKRLEAVYTACVSQSGVKIFFRYCRIAQLHHL